MTDTRTNYLIKIETHKVIKTFSNSILLCFHVRKYSLFSLKSISHIKSCYVSLSKLTKNIYIKHAFNKEISSDNSNKFQYLDLQHQQTNIDKMRPNYVGSCFFLAVLLVLSVPQKSRM